MNKVFPTPTPPVAASFKKNGNALTASISANENVDHLGMSEPLMRPGTFHIIPAPEEIFPGLSVFARFRRTL